MKISIQIAKTFLKLHKLKIYHGHLSSSNILFDNNYNVKIADIGFNSLKKYMSLKQSYTNKTYFSAPEHIEEKGLVVKNANSKSDVYSFGLILWEIFMETEAFEKLSLTNLKKIIISENSRPKI